MADWCYLKKRKFRRTHTHTQAHTHTYEVWVERHGQRESQEENHLQAEGRALEHILLSWLSEGIYPAWPQTSSLQNCKKINFCHSGLPVCDVLLWQSEQRNTELEVSNLGRAERVWALPKQRGLGFLLPTPEGHVASICESQQNGTALGSSHTDILCFILFWGPENKTFSRH